MVSDKRLFLVIGTNSISRQRTIKAIKDKLLKGGNAVLNVNTFYPKEVDLVFIQEKIVAFSFERNAIYILKYCDQLPMPIKKALSGAMDDLLLRHYLIAEMEKDYFQIKNDKKTSKDPLLSLLLERAAIFKVASAEPPASISDLKRSIRKRDLAASLGIIENLYKQSSKSNDLGPQLLGMLVYECAYISNPVIRKKRLSLLWQADRKMKTGVDSRLVIQTCLTALLS